MLTIWLKKINTLRLTCLALSAYVVQTFIFVVLNAIIKDVFIVGVISNLFIIVFCGLYYVVCIEPFGNKVGVFDNKKLPFSILFSVIALAISGFVISRWFMYEPVLQYNKTIAKSVEVFCNTSLPDINIFFYIIYVIFFVPIAEELVFRGFLFRHLYEINKSVAYYASVLFFALCHGNVIQMTIATLGGVLYAIIYVKTKSLRICVFAHSLYNTFAFLIAFLASVSGLDNLAWLYVVPLVIMCIVISIMSFILLQRTPICFEIKRIKSLTPEEQKVRKQRKAEWDEIYKEVEEERNAEKLLKEEERKVRVLEVNDIYDTNGEEP